MLVQIKSELEVKLVRFFIKETWVSTGIKHIAGGLYCVTHRCVHHSTL